MKRHAAEEIITKLRQAEQLMAGGQSQAQACKGLGVSVMPYHSWRKLPLAKERRELAAPEAAALGDAPLRHIRTRWHKTRITFRGDGHYARPEAMTWCENNGIDYICGRSGTRPLARKVDEVADDIRRGRAIENLAVLRGYTETRHKAKSWDHERRTVARIEATMLGLDIRFVVTSLDVGSAEWIYDSLYCARGQAENLIKLHKTQLASDRTSCRSALANQVRLVLHTAAYWLMLTVRDALSKVQDFATAP